MVEEFNPSSRKFRITLDCHGCAYESKLDCEINHLHIPAEEISCQVCIRNPNLDKRTMEEAAKNPTVRILSKYLTLPLDMYITMGWKELLEYLY